MPSLFIPFLVVGLVATGTSNSLWVKWQDRQCVENCDDPQNAVLFEQPVWQTLNMFVGEMLCFLPILFTFARSRFSRSAEPAPKPASHPGLAPLNGWRILYLWIPAACDLLATTLMNVGLLYCPVSIYQMTRGALVLFVGILSVLFLNRRLWIYQWFALITVVAGVCVVGLSGTLVKQRVGGSDFVEETSGVQVLVGVLFIAFAQVFTATQFVVEEKIMSHYSVAPLEAVGWEGAFGCISILAAMPILAQFADVSPFFDLYRGWSQIINTPTVLWASVAVALSISLFNFFGLSVTRHISATARSVTDTLRTLFIWLISLMLGWEFFVVPVSFLQVLGFGMLVYGTFLFNQLVKPPKCLAPPPIAEYEPVPQEDGERRHLLAEEHLDETARLPADLGTSGYDVIPPPQSSS